MKKTLMAIAAIAIMSGPVLAEDFDNTAVKLTAQTDNYSVSIKTPESGADELALGTNFNGVDATATVKRNGAVQDYQIKLNKSIDIATTPLYAGGNVAFNFGDSYTSDTRTLVATPYIGASIDVGALSPYAEAGFAWNSTANDITDLNEQDAYFELGAVYAVSPTMDLKASVVDSRDTDWNSTDKELELGMIVKF